jgi:hypothetical protein
MINLVSELIAQGKLGEDSMVTARISRRNAFGWPQQASDDYHLISVVENSGSFALTLREANGQGQLTVSSDDITAIDGMSVQRYAEIFNINPDGTARSTGRKRGRKPKIR